MHNSNIDWYSIYVSRLNNEYLTHVGKKYKIFIDTIVSDIVSTHCKTICEIGAGAANITRLISDKTYGCKFTVVDICPKMLELATINLKNATDKISYLCSDIRNHYGHRSDIVYSHGVLEHMSDKNINSTIDNWKAKRSLHYVPSARYEKPSMGDERLMTPEQWYKICRPTDIIEFNNGYDLILVFDKEDRHGV